MGLEPSTAKAIGRNRRNLGLYLGGLVLVVAGTVYLLGLNAEMDHWAQPVILAVAVAGLAGILFREAYVRDTAFVVSSLDAREANEEEAPALFEAAQRLTLAADLPMPRLYLTDDEGIAALSAGRSVRKSALILSCGAISALDKEELDGVVAHELSHIRHRDCLLRSILMFTAGFLLVLGYGFIQHILYGGKPKKDKRPTLSIAFVLLIVFLPILIAWVWLLGTLMRLIYAEQEYRADIGSAQLTRNPEGLARALAKLGTRSRRSTRTGSALVMLLDVVGPFTGKRAWEKLCTASPPLEERISRLMEMRSAFPG